MAAARSVDVGCCGDGDDAGFGRFMGLDMVAIMLVAVSMPMPAMGEAAAGVGAVFGLKGLVHRVHDQVHGAQHVGQYVVGFDLQVVGLELDGHVPVAQVVGRADQVVGRAVLGAMGDFEHRLGRRNHPHQRAVFSHQHVPATHSGATRQKNPERAPCGVGGVKTAFLPYIPVQFDSGCALEQRRGQAGALGDEFGGLEHQNKK